MLSGTKDVLDDKCWYPPHERYEKQKGWYQAKEPVEVGVADDEGRVNTEKRRSVCCRNQHFVNSRRFVKRHALRTAGIRPEVRRRNIE